MSSPRISVIIPTFNRAHLLSRSIDSLLSQTLSAHSVVIVDDGSTDGTENLVSEKYPEFTYLKQDNLGVSAARNAGITATSCEWLAFLDSDDLWYPEKLDNVYNQIQDQSETDVICHNERMFDQTNQKFHNIL